jgi:SsrA-binding protein
MNKAKAKSRQNENSTIALNKKAKHDYFIEDRFEAGIAMQGWEVKSCRAGKVQLVDSYVILKDGEAYLLGALITPLGTTSTHYVIDPRRTRKLLLNKRELVRLFQSVQQKGYTCVCTAMYWKHHLVKCEIALAKGKQDHDKRDTEKERDWDRERQRIVRQHNR